MNPFLLPLGYSYPENKSILEVHYILKHGHVWHNNSVAVTDVHCEIKRSTDVEILTDVETLTKNNNNLETKDFVSYRWKTFFLIFRTRYLNSLNRLFMRLHYHDNAVKTDLSKNCFSEFRDWECVVKKEVVKGIVMDPCVQLFISTTSDKAPKGQNTTSNLFTPSQTHIIHTLCGLTSLRWLTFHRGRRRGGTKRYFPSPSCPHFPPVFFSLLHLCVLFAPCPSSCSLHLPFLPGRFFVC